MVACHACEMSDAREPTTGEIMEVLLAFKDAVEMQFARIFREFARKSDLDDFARKSDLEDFARKSDLEDFARKSDLERLRYDMNKRFDGVDERFDRTDARLDRMDERFDAVEGRLGRLERPTV